jgi:hypothetical protein
MPYWLTYHCTDCADETDCEDCPKRGKVILRAVRADERPPRAVNGPCREDQPLQQAGECLLGILARHFTFDPNDGYMRPKVLTEANSSHEDKKP